MGDKATECDYFEIMDRAQAWCKHEKTSSGYCNKIHCPLNEMK